MIKLVSSTPSSWAISHGTLSVLTSPGHLPPPPSPSPSLSSLHSLSLTLHESSTHFRGGFLLPPDPTSCSVVLRDDVLSSIDCSVETIVWAGMGGSAEIVRAVVAVAGRRDGREVVVVDSSDPEALAEVLARCDEGRTMVVGVSMGMTSEEPVVVMTRALKRYPNLPVMVMTLEGSVVHRWATSLDRPVPRLPIQIDGLSTLSGRNSYVSRVALLPLCFLAGGEAVRGYLEQLGAVGQGERVAAFALSEILFEAAKAGRFHVVLLLPDPERAAPFGFWLAQQMEESLGKNSDLLFKVSTPTSLHANTGGLGSADKAVVVRFNNAFGGGGGSLGPLEGAPVHDVEVSATAPGGSTCPVAAALWPYPAICHWWTHVVLGIGVLSGRDTVGQYSVELYKASVQQMIAEAMSLGGLEVTPATKGAWITRADLSVAPAALTTTWRGIMGHEFIKAGELTVRAKGIKAAGSLRAWVEQEKPARGQVPACEYGEIVVYGDTHHTAKGREIIKSLRALADSLFKGLVWNVTEGPRDNHSRLEMTTAARNSGIIILVTDSLCPQRIASGSEYLALQALATFEAYTSQGRRTALLSSDQLPLQANNFEEVFQ
jgi:hypothetical protein